MSTLPATKSDGLFIDGRVIEERASVASARTEKRVATLAHEECLKGNLACRPVYAGDAASPAAGHELTEGLTAVRVS